jgi:hypothetical protein
MRNGDFATAVWKRPGAVEKATALENIVQGMWLAMKQEPELITMTQYVERGQGQLERFRRQQAAAMDHAASAYDVCSSR